LLHFDRRIILLIIKLYKICWLCQKKYFFCLFF